jgi:arabinogalactan oligomer/maltooligosaccharide transport system permease protein
MAGKLNKEASAVESFAKGDLYTKLSAVFMGAGLIGHKQIAKGILILLCEIAWVIYMIRTGIHSIALLPSLGDAVQEKVWNEAKQIYEYTAGDNSQQILLYGVVALFVVAAIVVLWILQMKHSYKMQKKIPVFPIMNKAYHSCFAETKQQQQDSSSADYNTLYGKDD